MPIYRLISILLFPLLVPYLILRILKGKEDKKRIKERFGFAGVRRPEGQIIWLHAVSVGETNSALILVDELLKTAPNSHILFTTTTLTSAAVLAEKVKDYDGRVIHQFLPLDSYFVVKRFINFWRPENVIFVESEIWPNLICEAAKFGAKPVLANARMSENSGKKWLSARNIGFRIFDNFEMIFAQSALDQERLKKLFDKEVLCFGNLKSEAADLSFEEKDLLELSEQILDSKGKKRKIWLASSTHKGEEEKVINAHKKLEKKYPDLLTILVPRHPNRASQVRELMSGLNVAQRSLGEKISSKTQIYLADTLGELGLFYHVSKIAFIGGSLADVGGHNPFEAIKLESLVISGRHVFNFKEIYAKLEQEMGYFLVESEDDLVSTVEKLLADDELCKSTIENATRAIDGDGKIAEKIAKRIMNAE